VDHNHIELVRLLLSCGADMHIATYSGRTPLKCCRFEPMRQLLRGHVSDVSGKSEPEDNISPWEITPSSIFQSDSDAKVLGQDVLADVPSDDDDDDSDDMVFDMSDAKVPQTYNLRLNINTGPKNYFLLSDILSHMGCTRKQFEDKYEDLKVESISSVEFSDQCAANFRNVDDTSLLSESPAATVAVASTSGKKCDNVVSNDKENCDGNEKQKQQATTSGVYYDLLECTPTVSQIIGCVYHSLSVLDNEDLDLSLTRQLSSSQENEPVLQTPQPSPAPPAPARQASVDHGLKAISVVVEDINGCNLLDKGKQKVTLQDSISVSGCGKMVSCKETRSMAALSHKEKSRGSQSKEAGVDQPHQQRTGSEADIWDQQPLLAVVPESSTGPRGGIVAPNTRCRSNKADSNRSLSPKVGETMPPALSPNNPISPTHKAEPRSSVGDDFDLPVLEKHDSPSVPLAQQNVVVTQEEMSDDREMPRLTIASY